MKETTRLSKLGYFCGKTINFANFANLTYRKLIALCQFFIADVRRQALKGKPVIFYVFGFFFTTYIGEVPIRLK